MTKTKEILDRAWLFFFPIIILFFFYYSTATSSTWVLFSVVTASVLGFILYNYAYRFVDDFRSTSVKANKVIDAIFIAVIILLIALPELFLVFRLLITTLGQLNTLLK